MGHDMPQEPAVTTVELSNDRLVGRVDLRRDHIRGPEDASITLVEYGDFECPHCGAAENVLRDLRARFGEDLRLVWRHLPLGELHPHAQLAAEAAEAAGAQGAFWAMHDLLLDHQSALTYNDLLHYANRLGLDTVRSRTELDSHTQTARVERDVQSAHASGVAGTPTFFINGRRHQGAADVAGLDSALRRARDGVPAPRTSPRSDDDLSPTAHVAWRP